MVINTKVTKIGTKNGSTPLVTVLTDILPTRATTNNAIPIGGVKIPNRCQSELQSELTLAEQGIVRLMRQ